MKKHFILVKLPGHDTKGIALSARAAAIKLLDAKFWPIFSRTRNKKVMAPGDEVAIYLGGQYNQLIIATATIEKIEPWQKSFKDRYPLTMDGIPESVLVLSNISVLKQPVDVTEILDSLTFIPKNIKKWGVAFMGGARLVNQADYNRLTDACSE